MANLRRIIKEIRNEKYDLVVNLQRYFSSALIAIRSGAAQTTGYSSSILSVFFNKRIPHVLGKVGASRPHEIERNQLLIDHICPGDASKPALYPSKRDMDIIQPYLSERFITISPASVWFTKQTPSDVWIDFINKTENIKVFLLGGPGDIELCDSIIKQCSQRNVVSLAGKISLLQSAALMKSALMNYTNDSAPMHLCSAVNAPVTAVFCSTIPEFGFGPLSAKSAVVQHRTTLDCKPCGIHGHKACPKGHFKCGKIEVTDLLSQLPDGLNV